jgi:hypothetical protein
MVTSRSGVLTPPRLLNQVLISPKRAYKLTDLFGLLDSSDEDEDKGEPEPEQTPALQKQR